MAVIWLSSEFNVFLLTYLITTFKEEYASGIGLGVADIIAYALSGALNSKMGVKRSLNISWALATASGLLLTTYGLSHQESWVFFTLIFVARLGVSFSFCNIYVAHAPMFPTLFCATSLGICNFLTKIFSAFSSIFAGLEEPIPMILFTTISAFTTVIVLGLQKNPDKRN